MSQKMPYSKTVGVEIDAVDYYKLLLNVWLSSMLFIELAKHLLFVEKV